MRTIAYVLFIFCIIYVVCDENFLGPGRIRVDRIEKSGDDLLGFKLDFMKHRVNRTHRGDDFNFTLPFPFDDSLSINLSASIWGDGGWKPNMYDVYQANACSSMMKILPMNTKGVFKALGQPEKCPLARGSYSFKNFVPEKINMTCIYGDFQLKMCLVKDGVAFTCVKIFYTCDPIKKS